MKYACGDERRREVVRALGTLNGIDYLEVIDHDAPTDDLRQRTLVLRLLRPAPALTADQVQISGGDRIPTIAVEWVARADDLPAGEDSSLVDGLTRPDEFWLIRTERYGDHSTYTLGLVAGASDTAAPHGFDPRLVSVDFSFKVECPSDLDCATCRPAGVAPVPAPELDYLAKDYRGFRRLMLDRLNLISPDWRERNAADVGVAVVETLAYVADQLSYRQDAIATEAYLDTARRRTSLRRHARLVDYRIDDGVNALAWVQIAASEDGTVAPRGLQLLTAAPGVPPRIAHGSPDFRDALERGAEVFETTEEVRLYAGHERLEFYTWGARDCCLPAGATSATLAGDWPRLKAGDVLVFVEAVGPQTGRAEDADPLHRWAVRLLDVRPGEDPSGGLFLEPPSAGAVPVTEITWEPEDALPFDLCLSAVAPAEDDEDLRAVSVALGNIVLADHGRTLDAEPLGAVPDSHLRWAPSPDLGDDCDAPSLAIPPRYTPRLSEAPLTHVRPGGPAPLAAITMTDAIRDDLDAGTFSTAVQGLLQSAGILLTAGPVSVQGGDGDWSVSDGAVAFRLLEADGNLQVRAHDTPVTRVALADAEGIRPAIALTSTRDDRTEAWTPRLDLLASSGDAREFVAEVEHDERATLRFGDDIYGKRPEPGTAFVARYRVGNGAAGNVGREAIAHLVTDDARLVAVTNPLPAAGGRDPEGAEDIRRNAPEAFRVQRRAVTEADYASVAGRFTDAQRASATFRWTGSWHTVFLTVDRLGARAVDAGYEADLRAHLDEYRMAGHDVEVDDPRHVALDVGLDVCVLPDYFRAHVKESLLRVLGGGWGPDGQPALFHPDRFTFGQPAYLSDIYAAAQAVPGVESVVVHTFQRLHAPDPRPLDEGVLEMGRLEIARLANDPNFPERGLLRLNVEGGK
ncbi:MAG: putative baseplate assembly protein [Dehalococcoidia bacterium]|nr:putative baseplate assembly protein [Dehalococcoidia bacterium]